jgi:hypothetical protein
MRCCPRAHFFKNIFLKEWLHSLFDGHELQWDSGGQRAHFQPNGTQMKIFEKLIFARIYLGSHKTWNHSKDTAKERV